MDIVEKADLEPVEKYGLGQTVPRFEDQRLLSGGGRYIDDITYPGMLFGYVLRSPHAHARIVSIDVSAAKEMPGVELILTGDDCAAKGFGTIGRAGAGTQNKRGIKPFMPRRTVLARERVRFVGDPVVFIVADTLANAKDASEAVEIDYDPLPASVSTADAATRKVPVIWDEQPDNVAFMHELGNEEAVDAAIAKADHVIRRRLHISRVLVASMEGRGCVTDYDPRADFYTVHIGCQSAFSSRAEFARALNEPESKIRVITGDVGGSFGMKGLPYPEHLVTAYASKILERPVKWVAERSEGCIADNQGRDNVSDATLALDKEGKFLALKVHTYASIGGYPSTMPTGSPTNNLGTLAGVYTTPYIYVQVEGVYTNNTQTGSYRGAGRPEAAYVIERMVDLAAHELKIDPVELRRRNLIPPITKPYKSGLIFTYDSGEFEALMDKTLAMIDYDGFEARREESKKRGKLRGIGVSVVIERAAAPGFEAAQIRIAASGAITVMAGTTDQGQGHKTMYTQILCERLNVDPSKIRVVEGDTDGLGMGSGTGGSRVSTLGSSAVLAATDKIIEKGRRIAAHALEAAYEDTLFNRGRFTISGTDRTLALGEVAKLAHDPTKLPPGMEPGLTETGAYTAKVANYPNGCQICELEVDEDDGTVKILKYVVVDDVGRMLNPMGVHGQVHGGVAMGVGQALMECMQYDSDSGQPLTGSFMDYAMPRADMCPEPELEEHSVPTPTNPLGVKGVGEAGTVGALPATMNAVINALMPLGIVHLDMPLTSEKLWRAIQEARTGKAA